MIPQPCRHCGELVCRDVQGQLYATLPSNPVPWSCPDSPTLRHALPETAAHSECPACGSGVRSERRRLPGATRWPFACDDVWHNHKPAEALMAKYGETEG